MHQKRAKRTAIKEITISQFWSSDPTVPFRFLESHILVLIEMNINKLHSLLHVKECVFRQYTMLLSLKTCPVTCPRQTFYNVPGFSWYVLRSSGVSRNSVALIVRYSQKKKCISLFWESFYCYNFGTTGLIQVRFSAKMYLS